jgi:hypothetical protein
MTTFTAPDSALRRGNGVEALLVVLVGGALLWLIAHVAQVEWRAPQQTAVSLEGTHYRVGPEELRWLDTFSAVHFAAGEAEARGLVAAEIDERLDAVFAQAGERLPEFLDWYYSLRGEYSRVAMAALALVNLADPGYVAERASAALFPEDAWLAHLESLERIAAERLDAHGERLRAGWLVEVSRRLAAHRVPAPLLEASTGRQAPLVLDALVGDVIAREQSALASRLSVSGAAAAASAAAAPALGRAAARGGRAVASRTAARAASRAGTAAAGGAAVCAWGGPAAAACAVLAGAGAWLLTDWALLSIDEQMNRSDLERSLEEALAGLRARVEADLLAAYDLLISDHYATVQRDIRRGFVPARAGSE